MAADSVWTDLHHAALLDLPALVGASIDAGMRPDTQLDINEKMFMLDRLHPAKAWLEDRTLRYLRGQTPLMFAALVGSREAVAALIARGADIHAEDNLGQTPIFYSAAGNAHEVAELLLDRGLLAKNWMLKWAARAGVDSREVAGLLLDRGARVNAKDDDGETPLDIAIYWENGEMEELLRRRGGRCNVLC